MFCSNMERFIFSNGSETSPASPGRLATSVGGATDGFGFSVASREPTSVAEGNEGPVAAQAESIAASTIATAHSTMERKTLITPPHPGLMIVVLLPAWEAFRLATSPIAPKGRSVPQNGRLALVNFYPCCHYSLRLRSFWGGAPAAIRPK